MINTLSNDELKKVWENNQKLKDEIFQRILDDEYYFVQNEIYGCFRHYDSLNSRETWSMETHESSQCFYITVKESDYSQFLEDCRNLIKYVATEFTEDNEKMIERLSQKVDFYRDCVEGYEDISDDRFQKLEKWFDKGINDLAGALKETVDKYIDSAYDSDYSFEYFADGCFLDDSELYIIDNDYTQVYEDITKVYR